jgi:hypothetical protein
MGTVESHVTLTGVVALSGFTKEFTDTATYPAVSNTIANMITGLTSNSVQVLSTNLDSRAMTASVSSIVQDYTFQVKLIAEHSPFSIDGRSYAAVQNLVSSMASTLSSSMSSGQFESKLQMETSLLSVASISSQAVAELISLEVSDVTYIGSESMISSTLPTVSWSDDYQYSGSSSGLEAGLTFLGVAVVGFVAFVGIMSKGIQKYDSLPTESLHSEVVASDMDTSIAPRAEQSVFNVDSTPISTDEL